MYRNLLELEIIRECWVVRFVFNFIYVLGLIGYVVCWVIKLLKSLYLFRIGIGSIILISIGLFGSYIDIFEICSMCLVIDCIMFYDSRFVLICCCIV